MLIYLNQNLNEYLLSCLNLHTKDNMFGIYEGCEHFKMYLKYQYK